jgi:hypothetical protein
MLKIVVTDIIYVVYRTAIREALMKLKFGSMTSTLRDSFSTQSVMTLFVN